MYLPSWYKITNTDAQNAGGYVTKGEMPEVA
jgi:hypothetical protein